jgi:hypothetical protein
MKFSFVQEYTAIKMHRFNYFIPVMTPTGPVVLEIYHNVSTKTPIGICVSLWKMFVL